MKLPALTFTLIALLAVSGAAHALRQGPTGTATKNFGPQGGGSATATSSKGSKTVNYGNQR
jgi:hypothetical protein